MKIILNMYHSPLLANILMYLCFQSHNILSFEETVFIDKAEVVYKIANDTIPIYLTDLFQIRGNDSYLNNSQLNLRSTSKNFLTPKPKISLFKTVCLIQVHLCGIAFPYG